MQLDPARQYCDRKVNRRYKVRFETEAAAMAFAVTQPEHSITPFRGYLCRSCGGWHLTKTHTKLSRTPNCSSCGGPCLWSTDWWYCPRCGDEWCADHHPM